MGETHRTRFIADFAAAWPFLVNRQESDNRADEETPIWTFRVLVLGSVSFFILLILNKYVLKQTSEWLMAMASGLAILYPSGYVMAKLIRRRRVYYPTLGLEFCTNPGPFRLKEYAIISIIANVGATIGGFTSHYVDWSYS